MPSLLPTIKCPCLQSSRLPCGVMGLTVVCRFGPSLDFLGRNHSFRGFLSLDQCSLGIGYLWHAEGAWASSDHDVDPLSSTCTREMVGIHYFPCSLYFPQLFFIKVTYFPTGFHFLMCHGIHLEVIMTIFSEVSTLSIQQHQINSDIKLCTSKNHLMHPSVFGLFMVTILIGKVT